MSSPPEITGARGTGPLASMLRPDYGAFKKRKRRPKKRRVPPRPPQVRNAQMRGGY